MSDSKVGDPFLDFARLLGGDSTPDDIFDLGKTFIDQAKGEKTRQAGLACWKYAADEGHVGANLAMADIHLNGDGADSDSNPALAIAYYTVARECAAVQSPERQRAQEGIEAAASELGSLVSDFAVANFEAKSDADQAELARENRERLLACVSALQVNSKQTPS